MRCNSWQAARAERPAGQQPVCFTLICYLSRSAALKFPPTELYALKSCSNFMKMIMPCPHIPTETFGVRKGSASLCAHWETKRLLPGKRENSNYLLHERNCAVVKLPCIASNLSAASMRFEQAYLRYSRFSTARSGWDLPSWFWAATGSRLRRHWCCCRCTPSNRASSPCRWRWSSGWRQRMPPRWPAAFEPRGHTNPWRFILVHALTGATCPHQSASGRGSFSHALSGCVPAPRSSPARREAQRKLEGGVGDIVWNAHPTLKTNWLLPWMRRNTGCVHSTPAPSALDSRTATSSAESEHFLYFTFPLYLFPQNCFFFLFLHRLRLC